MNYTREQAEAFLAQGSLCRAAVVAESLVADAPTTENIELLAEVYMRQGLNEDAMALYAKIVTQKTVVDVTYGGYVN